MQKIDFVSSAGSREGSSGKGPAADGDSLPPWEGKIVRVGSLCRLDFGFRPHGDGGATFPDERIQLSYNVGGFTQLPSNT